MNDVVLLKPDESMLDEIASYKREFQEAHSSMDGTGSLKSMDDPREFLRFCRLYERRETTPEHLVPATQFVLFRPGDQKLLGMVQIRHTLNDYLAAFGGHIGYSVRPSERRKGYAGEMLRMALAEAKDLGIDHVLITCLEGNEGSRKTILKNGGVYENTVAYEGNTRLERYWIDLT